MPKITFMIKKNEERILVEDSGQSILNIALKNKLGLEGTCGGSLACSTCHVFVDKLWYGRLSPPSQEEIDTLELCMNFKPTSRLGCQIRLSKETDGIKLYIPE